MIRPREKSSKSTIQPAVKPLSIKEQLIKKEINELVDFISKELQIDKKELIRELISKE